MPPPVRYARSGDLSIAYQVIGQGPPDLIWCIGSYSHLDLLWEDPVFARTFERLGETARLLLFDKRGMGLSDRTDTLYTLEQRVDDIRAVLDAAESGGAYLMGFSEGGAMAGLFAATSPERTEGLIFYGAPAAYARKPDWPYGPSEEEFEAFWRARRELNYEEDFSTPVWQRFLGPALADDTAFLEWWRRLRRSMGSPAALYAQARMNRLIDVRPILPSIRVPTLIMVREDDPLARLDTRRKRPLGEDHVRLREVLQQKVEAPRRVFRVVAARQRAARHERRGLAVEGYLALADRLQAGIEPAPRGLQEQAGRGLARRVGRIFHAQGHDRGQDRRAALAGMNRGDAPDRKHTAQALGELIGNEVLGLADNHGRREYNACSSWPFQQVGSIRRCYGSNRRPLRHPGGAGAG
jgi:pimeloyl-ACP methyl ester carboxylesterase